MIRFLQYFKFLKRGIYTGDIRCVETGVEDDEKVVSRVENMLQDVFIGDAVQTMLPRNWRVPYIGWHPVEDKMRPRNLYDHTVASWGRKMPREYGVPNKRKLFNLSRLLFMESVKLSGSTRLRCSVDQEKHIQFIRAADDKLMRLNLDLPLTVYSDQPLAPLTPGDHSAETVPVPDLAPLNPLVSLHPTNIYRDQSTHPVTSTSHSSPFSHTLIQHYTSHIAPQVQKI